MEPFVFIPFPTLNNTRITLRQLKEEDISALVALRSDEQVNRYIKRPKQATPEAVKAFIININNNIADGKCLYWAICFNDNPVLIGTICFWNFSDNKAKGEVGYELSPQHHRKGIMNEALQLVITYAIENLGFKTLEAYTHHENKSSILLLEKNGFKHDPAQTDTGNADNLIYSRVVQ